MARTTETIDLPAPAPGTRRTLTVHRWGTPGARPKAYFQAALHADETPGLLMLDHLAARLDELDAKGAITGEIVMLPYANPIGLDQAINDRLLGRYRFADGGGNFNRDWPDLARGAAERLSGKLVNDPDGNVRLVREALLAEVSVLPERTEREAHHKALLGLSVDADMVFDVHCDWRATLHLYASNDHTQDVADLGCDMAVPVILLDDEIVARPFDSANNGPWRELRQALNVGPDTLPSSCFAVTVELRGEADVTDEYASSDAGNMLRYLMRRGVIDGDPGPLPEPVGAPAPLEAIYSLRAPAAGVVVWKKNLGDTVAAGDVVAELVAVGTGKVPSERVAIKTHQSGILFSMHVHPMHRPGEGIGKVAGREPLERRPGEQLLSNR